MDDNVTSKRELSPEELRVAKEAEQRKIDEARQDKRLAKNDKIRCPCCKKNQYFNEYSVMPSFGALLCMNCGIIFIDQEKLKIIKRGFTEKNSSAGIISAPTAG